MAGRIPGNSIRMFSNLIRGMGKTGKSERASRASSLEFAGHHVSVQTPTPLLYSILENISQKGFSNSSAGKPLSSYDISVSADKQSLMEKAMVGLSEAALSKLGTTKQILQKLQNSIRTAFSRGVQLSDAKITTIASGVPPSQQAQVEALLRFIKNAD